MSDHQYGLLTIEYDDLLPLQPDERALSSDEMTALAFPLVGVEAMAPPSPSTQTYVLTATEASAAFMEVLSRAAY